MANMPSVEDLLSKEVVDKLGYMGWQVDQGADPVKVVVPVWYCSTFFHNIKIYSTDIQMYM